MEIKRYFVIGNPINHSLSPKLHNYWIKQHNINAIYEKIKLEENEIESFIDKIRNHKIDGCNITVPFKKKVIPFLDKLSSEAEKTQSVNTIINNGGNLIGYNTDIYGFEKAAIFTAFFGSILLLRSLADRRKEITKTQLNLRLSYNRNP